MHRAREAATNMEVSFNYQVDSAGPPHDEDRYSVSHCANRCTTI